MAADFDSALAIARRRLRGNNMAFAIGGTAVYATALKTADRLYITWVEGKIDGDTWFPEVNWEQWRETASEPHPADAEHDHSFRIAIYDRLPAPANR